MRGRLLSLNQVVLLSLSPGGLLSLGPPDLAACQHRPNPLTHPSASTDLTRNQYNSRRKLPGVLERCRLAHARENSRRCKKANIRDPGNSLAGWHFPHLLQAPAAKAVA